MSRKIEMLVKDYMHPAVIIIRKENTVEETLQILRKRGSENKVFYFYVVGEGNTLIGTVGTRTLLVAEPHMNIGDIMDSSLVWLQEDDTFEKAM